MGTCDVTHYAINVYIENILLSLPIHERKHVQNLKASLFCKTDNAKGSLHTLRKYLGR